MCAYKISLRVFSRDSSQVEIEVVGGVASGQGAQCKANALFGVSWRRFPGLNISCCVQVVQVMDDALDDFVAPESAGRLK